MQRLSLKCVVSSVDERLYRTDRSICEDCTTRMFKIVLVIMDRSYPPIVGLRATSLIYCSCIGACSSHTISSRPNRSLQRLPMADGTRIHTSLPATFAFSGGRLLLDGQISKLNSLLIVMFGRSLSMLLGSHIHQDHTQHNAATQSNT